MSVRFKNSAGINLGSDPNAGKGAGAATLAFRIRFNWPPASGGGMIYFHNQVLDWSTATADTVGGRMNFYQNWWMSAGTCQGVGQVYTNTVNHVVITYDKTDPTKQALYINGARTLMNNPLTASFDDWRSTALRVGVFDPIVGSVDFDCEGVLYLSGYAVTQDEVNAMRAGADPTTFGLSAIQRGYWPLTGPSGQAVAATDPGIANALAPSFPSSLFLGSTPGTSMVYGDAMPYVSPVNTGDFAVYTSGRTVRVGFNMIATGAPVSVVSADATKPPTIRIDGGPPITLERPLFTSHYSGLLYFLPDGVSVPKGSAVTVTTQDNWLNTNVGLVMGVTNQTIPNRTGEPVYGDLPATLRVGLNYSYRVSYWHDEIGTRNAATRMQITNGAYQERPDQTVMQDVMRMVYSPHSGYTPHPVDGTGGPKELGWHAVGWDDQDPTHPTEIILRSNDGYHASGVNELTQFHNPGDAQGNGKVRVFDVQKVAFNVALAAACGATDTTITLVNASGVAGDPNIMAIKIDDEYMIVQSVNLGTGSVTVTRGQYGTTAAAHAAAAVGTVTATQQFYDLSLSITNPTTGIPNYKNLVLYGPSDWTHPTAPGPVTLDKSEAYAKSPSQYDLTSLQNGSGVVRQMDSTDGGFGRGLEPEHMRFDTDLWPGETYNFVVRAKVVSSQTATAADCPYVYSAFQLQNAVKYPVVLAAPITTAPPAGTVETIQITEDAANPVFYGQRIEFPSGEIVRCLSQSGNSVSVVRGAERTTPATQAAGTVQAMWRIPVPNDAALQTNGEARILQTCDQNHGLWNGMVSLPQSNDLNPLARINVTLTAAVATTTENVFHVSVAPADAPYLTSGLFIVFDSECVLVDSYDSTAGTIVVERNYCSAGPGRLNWAQGMAAGTHASGTVGTGSSCGAYCVSQDGTKHAWPNQAGYRSSLLVTGPKTFISSVGGLAPYDAHPWSQVGVQNYAPQVDDDTCRITTGGPDAVYSFEQSARTTAAAPGADHWLNVPQWCANDMVDVIAAKIRDGLPAGKHRVLVELGNEIWNWGSPRLKNARELSAVCGYGDGGDSFIYRSWEVYKRVKAVFDDAGRGGEVRHLLAWQQGGVGYLLQRAQALGIDSDVHVVSTAPYFLPFSEPNLNAAYNAATDEEALDVWKFDFEYNYANIAGSLYNDGKARRDYQAATGRTIDFIHYEGGPDSFTPTPAADIQNGYMRNWDLHYNPNCRYAAYDFPYICNRVGGSDGIAFFNYVFTEFWNAGAGYSSLWGVSAWHGQPPGAGDGSDGKADNRLCLATPGKPNSKPPYVNLHEHNVSVRLQALLDYNAKFAAAGPPPDSGVRSASGGIAAGGAAGGALAATAAASGGITAGGTARRGLAAVENVGGGIAAGGTARRGLAAVENVGGGIAAGGIAGVGLTGGGGGPPGKHKKTKGWVPHSNFR